MTPELPHHLAPWARELAIFPSGVALTLGSMVTRLAGLVGQGPVAHSNDGDPDGYGGIARKGSYERLLPAEWLLLDEVPEEFFRRVVANEHVFLERAYAQQSGVKRCVALFDASTDQLGAPRLVHLAILVLLAQRASAHGASFEWGIVQDEPSSLHDGVTPANVIELLKSRGRKPVASGDVDRWATHLQAASERWLVGASALEREAARLRASSIHAEDALEPGPGRIVVRATTLGRTPKGLVLDVPEDRAAVRLLRDPFSAVMAPRKVTPTAIDPQSKMAFSPNAQLLYVRNGPSSLVSVQVPNSSRAGVAPPVTFDAPAGQTIHAVGRSLSTKRTLVVSRGEDGLFLLHRLSKRGASAAVTDRYAAPGDGTPLFHGRLQPLAVIGEQHFCFVDGDGAFLELVNGATFRRKTGRVLASAVSHEGFGWLEVDGEHPRAMWMPAGGRATVPPVEASVSSRSLAQMEALHFAGGPKGVFAYARSSTSWTSHSGARRSSVEVADGSTVVGVVAHYHEGGEGLLALSDDRSRIDFVMPGRHETLVTVSGALTSLVVSGRATEFAWLTENGQLGVYSTRSRSVVRRLGGPAS